MMQGQGPVNWDAARQFALSIVSQSGSEPNVDPIARMRLEELVRVADLHVAAATGLSTSVAGGIVTALPVTRAVWAQRTLDSWRPTFERLARALSADPDA